MHTQTIGISENPPLEMGSFKLGLRGIYLLFVQVKTKNTNTTTPSPPAKSFPTKSPRVELSGRPPMKLYGHENSNPLELRTQNRLCPVRLLRVWISEGLTQANS